MNLELSSSTASQEAKSALFGSPLLLIRVLQLNKDGKETLSLKNSLMFDPEKYSYILRLSSVI